MALPPSHQRLKTPPTLKYLCFPCRAASNVIDEARVDGRSVFSFQSSCNLSLAAASLSPRFPARPLLPPLMALPPQTLHDSLFFSL